LLDSANLFGAESMIEVQERLLKYKAGRPETGTQEQWLRGVGWDQANFNGLWPKSVRLFYANILMFSMSQVVITGLTVM
jgi:hypothetical protein